MIGFKGFNKDLCCKGFQYDIGETYELESDIELCRKGFHFCDIPINVLLYYDKDCDRYAIIEALGEIKWDQDKLVTNKIRIVQELTKEELIKECGNKTFNVLTGVYHFKNNLLHNDNDFPAVILYNGVMKWYQNGVLHRENDQPAMICNKSNNSYWYLNGAVHRDNDQPAIIHGSGSKYWYQHGKLHRDNDQPAIIIHNTFYWYQNGKIHRDNDQPAIIYNNGEQIWYQNGEVHRENDQPAVVRPDGTMEYYIKGRKKVDV